MPHIPFVVSPSGGFSGPNGPTTNGSYRCEKQNENCWINSGYIDNLNKDNNVFIPWGTWQ